MAQTYRSRQLRLERELQERFGLDMAELARLISLLILSYAVVVDGRRVIPNRRTVRDAIAAAVWARLLKPYFIGSGDFPFNGPLPASPFARIIYDGVQRGMEIVAEQQVAIVRSATAGADDVYQYMTGGRPILAPTGPTPRGVYDPFHRWVDPNGYVLSDRVWQSGLNVRARINKLLDYHISRGTSAEDMAKELERFLTPGAAVMRTNTPYGREGGYAALRLARTEITAAAGRGVINASIANPFVTGVGWFLSLSHPCCDICDTHAAGGENSDGVYPPESVPTYPAHPNELCNLRPVVTESRAAVVERIRADMRSDRRYQGIINRQFMVDGLVNGYYNESAAVKEMVTYV